MEKSIVFTFVYLFTIAGAAHAQTEYKIGNNRVLVDMPVRATGTDKMIVIAPAKKYLMKRPLFASLAKMLVKKGYLVVRFDWGFVEKSSKPSENLQAEALELERVVTFFQKKFSFSKENTFIVAKSFGSRVLMKGDLSLANHFTLMTPNCDDAATFSQTYGKLFSLDVRIHIAISTTDPYCKIGQIYNFMSSNHSRTTISSTFGLHNFETKRHLDQNQNLALLQIVNWVQQL